jgi:predicted ATPase with chaperone activity
VAGVDFVRNRQAVRLDFDKCSQSASCWCLNRLYDGVSTHIADLAGEDRSAPMHLAEAIQYQPRGTER